MQTAEIKKWCEVSRFHFVEMANLRRPTPPTSIRPRGTEQAGGSQINFGRPSEQKTRPGIGLFGGLARHPDAILPLETGNKGVQHAL